MLLTQCRSLAADVGFHRTIYISVNYEQCLSLYKMNISHFMLSFSQQLGSFGDSEPVKTERRNRHLLSATTTRRSLRTLCTAVAQSCSLLS